MKHSLKAIISYSLAVVVCLFFFSCVNNIQNEESPPLPSTPDNIPIPIAISGQILQALIQTRTTDNTFDNEDAIGLYVVAQPEVISGVRHIENVRFICSSSGLVPDEEIFYPKGSGKCDFISYYPYQEEAIVQGTSNMQICIKPDQSSDIDYSSSDFMTSTINDITPSKKAVDLRYNHKLFQLNIVIQLNGDEDINMIRQDASVNICSLNSQAIYNIDTEIFTNFSVSQDIIPNGQWIANEENHQLSGKRVLLIPQQTTNCELTLKTGNKTYSALLPPELVLESGMSCELLLKFDSREGIGSIIPSIGEWQQGTNGNANLEEKEETDFINIANLNFEQTGVYDLSTVSNTSLGEVCKEYLRKEGINLQAIVLYPAKDKNNGIVLQILDEANNVHGGTVNWDIANNSFSYTPGDKAPIQKLYADKEGNIIFEANEENKIIQAIERILTDIRGNERITYPIVKIGTQYWMRENLSATKYNDGSTITNNTTQLSKATAGYYYRNNYFYNKAAIITGKMPPKGWKIPNEAEWETLKQYVNNEVSVLKAGTWTSETDIAKANNKSGFTGKAVGSYYKGESPTAFNGINEYVSYWKTGETSTSLSELGITFTYKMNDVRGALYSNYCAYSIRCIKE